MSEPDAPSLRALIGYFLQLGTTGFGGPVALVGYMQRDLVETNPDAQLPLIVPLACALIAAHGNIHLVDHSSARALYGVAATVESYHCRFGLDPRFCEALEAALTFTGFDADGDPRIFELHDHAFLWWLRFRP